MPQRPNVILIMADDMGYGDIATVNGGINTTPALDDLYHRSLRCSQGYAASCVCAPSRAGFLTGRYPHRTGCTCLNDIHLLNQIALEEQTIADVFAQGGYHTGLIGKWHCGHNGNYRPEHRGFQHVETYHPQTQDYWNWTIDENGSPRQAQGEYLTDYLTDCTLRYIRQHQHEPFFLHLAYYAPHRPLQATEETLAHYLDRDELTEGQKRVYAMIESMDHGIGQIMNLLEELDLDRNTIVIFTSDNGPDDYSQNDLSPSRSNMGLRGCKYSVHDGGIRVPMLVHWPDGMLTDRTTETLFHFVDFIPTLSAACGIPLPRTLPLDGENRLPVWQGEEHKVQPVRFWQWNRHYPYPQCNAAMRDGDWKLLYPKLNGYNKMTQENIEMILGKIPFESSRPYPLELGPPTSPMLFNLANDPHEQHDLAASHTERVDRMTVAMENWYEDVIADFSQALDTRFA